VLVCPNQSKTNNKEFTMTKKDYIILARALQDSKPQTTGNLNDDYILLKSWNITVESIAYELAKDNTRFHRNTFLTACGYLPK
jgi:hypothetical protein